MTRRFFCASGDLARATINKFGQRTRYRSERTAVVGLELDDEDLKAVNGRCRHTFELDIV